MGEVLHVRGGAGGTAAELDDLDRTGRVLRSASASLSRYGASTAAVAAAEDVRFTGLISPLTLARAEALLALATVGPRGLLTLSAELEAVGLSVTAAADAYRAAEAAVSSSLRRSELLVGRGAGALAGAVVADSGVGVGAAVVVVVLGADPGLRDRVLSGPLRRLGGLTLGLLASHATSVELVLPVVPGAIGGVIDVLPGGGALATAIFGRPGGPRTSADVACGLGRLGTLAGRTDGRTWLHDQGLSTIQVGPARAGRAAPDLGVLVGRIPSSSSGAPRIRVERLAGTSGPPSWVVSVPGTTAWSPVPGRTPFDLTGDVQLMAGEPSAGTSAVVAAMRRVGVRKGDPVLLVGHSQGGLIAAAVAADPAVRREFTVTHVLTAGSPIAAIRIPDDVQVLALEHSDDLVPRLDATRNPDRANWVTVSTSTPVLDREAPAPDGSPPPPPEVAAPGTGRALAAHRLAGYQLTAVRIAGSTDPSVTAWRRSAAVFFDRPHLQDTVQDVDVSRAGGS